jgi:hypothetical protein
MTQLMILLISNETFRPSLALIVFVLLVLALLAEGLLHAAGNHRTRQLERALTNSVIPLFLIFAIIIVLQLARYIY